MVNIFSWKEAFVWLLGSPKPPKPGIAQPRNVIFWHPHCFNFVVENPHKLPRDSGVQFGWYLNVQKSKLNVFKIICLGMRAKVVIKFFKAFHGKATDEIQGFLEIWTWCSIILSASLHVVKEKSRPGLISERTFQACEPANILLGFGLWEVGWRGMEETSFFPALQGLSVNITQ